MQPNSSLRQILPRLTPTHPAPGATSSSNERVVLRRRPVTTAACEGCRQSRVRCSAERPTCSACMRYGRACVYTTAPNETRHAALNRERNELKRKYDELASVNDDYGRIFHMMQSGRPQEISFILDRIRGGLDPATIIRHVDDADLLLQLHLVPETSFRYEFPWRKEMPSRLLSPHDVLRSSRLYRALFPPGKTVASSPASDAKKCPEYYAPIHAATIEDSRIDEVKPSLWTSVSKNDPMLRRLLHAYFRSEYCLHPPFRIDSFLEGMLSGCEDYCSPLLVNVVLVEGWFSSLDIPKRGQYWDPQNLGYILLAEARRLWALECAAETWPLTTFQASIMLGKLLAAIGLQKESLNIVIESAERTQALDLMKASMYDTIDLDDTAKDNWKLTAWCMFQWQSLFSYHMMRRPLLQKPPDFALPDPDTHSAWYGEIKLRYPMAEAPYDIRWAHHFKAKGDLHTILTKFSLASWLAEGTMDSNEMCPVKLIALKQEFIDWYHTLPVEVSCERMALPFHFQIPLYYHFVLMQLNKLAVLKAISQRSRTDHSASFELLVRLCYLRHGHEAQGTMHLQWTTQLAFLALEQLKELKASRDSQDDDNRTQSCGSDVQSNSGSDSNGASTASVAATARSTTSDPRTAIIDIATSASPTFVGSGPASARSGDLDEDIIESEIISTVVLAMQAVSYARRAWFIAQMLYEVLDSLLSDDLSELVQRYTVDPETRQDPQIRAQIKATTKNTIYPTNALDSQVDHNRVSLSSMMEKVALVE